MSINRSDDLERNQLARYQILAQHRQHLDRQFWSRVQILHLIQAGVLAGSFYLWKYHCVPPAFYLGILVLGIILTIILRIICKYDWDDVEENKKRLYHLGDTLGIRWGAERQIQICKFGRAIRIPKCCYGHNLFLYGVFPLFIVVDSLLFLYFLNPHIFDILVELLVRITL